MKSPRHSCGDKDWERAGDTAWEYHSRRIKSAGKSLGGKWRPSDRTPQKQPGTQPSTAPDSPCFVTPAARLIRQTS